MFVIPSFYSVRRDPRNFVDNGKSLSMRYINVDGFDSLVLIRMFFLFLFCRLEKEFNAGMFFRDGEGTL